MVKVVGNSIGMASFKIALTFVGTVVGAGFASGQEILQFFVRHGGRGGWGIGLAMLAMGIAMVKIFKIGCYLKSDSYSDFLKWLIGPRWLCWADLFFFLLMLLLMGVMFAGCGALFEELHLGYNWGIFWTTLIVISVLTLELAGLVIVNVIIVPLMFLATLTVAIFSLVGQVMPEESVVAGGTTWMVAALQFSAYNIILAIPVLMSLANQYSQPGILRRGGWLGCICLGMMTAFIYGAIRVRLHDGSAPSFPMVELAKIWGKPVFFGYIFIIWGEMLTTLLANAYGLGKRVAVLTGWPFVHVIWILAGLGIGIARIGFVDLIRGIYPIYGYLSMGLLTLMLIKPVLSPCKSNNRYLKPRNRSALILKNRGEKFRG